MPAPTLTMTTNMPYRLRLPGPTAVPERIRQAIARPLVNHRGPEMRATIGSIRTLVAPLFGTESPVLMFASSGTGVMEASLVNILGPGERVLAIVHGQFGERYATIASALGATVDVIDVVWGEAPDVSVIESHLQRHDYRAVIIVHNESSTGIVPDLEAIGSLVQDRPTLLIVDSISGLGGMEMQQDKWGIDIVVSGSQKALMCPPGLGLVSISDKARKVIEQDDRLPRYYWDFRKALAVIDNNETAFTPAVSLLEGLNEALLMLHEEGLEQVLERHRLLSNGLRTGLRG